MRRTRTLAALTTAALATALTAGTLLAAPPATAYPLPVPVDVTAQTISKPSAPDVVRVTRVIVEVPGTTEQAVPTLAYQYRMDPTEPEDSFGLDCQVYRDGAVIVDESCSFVSGFFQDALKNPASGRYELMREGKKVSAWTYTAPKASKPPALKPAGCTVTGLSINPKPRTITDTTNAFGESATTYTMNARGTQSGNCKGVRWGGTVSYSIQTPTGGIVFGFMSGDLVWSGKKLKTVTFTFDADANVSDTEFMLQVSGVTPGWRANFTKTAAFTVTG